MRFLFGRPHTKHEHGLPIASIFWEEAVGRKGSNRSNRQLFKQIALALPLIPLSCPQRRGEVKVLIGTKWTRK